MRVLGLDHVSVTVADLERSLGFYHGLLGIRVLGTGVEESPSVTAVTGARAARFRYADLDLGSGQILELLQYLTPRGKPHRPEVYDPGSGHLAVRVDRLEAALGALRHAGFEPRSEPVELDEPAWWAGARVVYVTDPDGVTVELVERRRTPLRESQGANRHRGSR
ncbi:MAG TPA: VOC family protein [Thermoplasmata archaeon]|nr:VOC family protein [Thermoplasmata archaeon]